MLAISVGAFGDLSVFGFSIRNILSILIVLILGWKNGVLVGTTAGVTIGVTLGVITSSEPIMVAAYAISGMIAGILNKFGKLGVIIGFCLGNIVLAYVSNGYTVELIHFKEILIASIGLLALPKSVQINIKEFMGNSKFLPVFPDRALNKSKETAERLNNVSDTIQEMAKTYKTQETQIQQEPILSNKDIFVSELLDNLSGYEDNMLYDDISKTDGPIVDEIFKVLVDKQKITREALLEIFAKCNSFIIGFDDKKISEYLEENIAQMIRVINMSYKISKSSFVWQKKFEENKKNIETQLQGVSKAISSIAENIEKNIKNHIYILGIGEEKEKYEKYLTENNLTDTFTFLGYRDNPYKYVKKADLYVCSSRREGFSTAVTEALIVGTPVVSTNCSGAYELLGENNEYGIVTENNEDALYEGIKKMLTTPDLLEAYAAKAKERGKAFSTEKTVKAVEEMLSAL